MAEETNNQQMNHVSTFLKGMMQDIDINKIPADYYLTGEDIKLMDKEGQGYILSNVDGNEYAFSLSTDFIPLGSREHKDILYIVSCSKDGLGVGEMGTFPSINPVTNEWELQYRPLRNYASEAPITHIFRTDKLSLFPEHRVEIQIKDDFDGTVNIYLADGENQLRVINSGFNQSGEIDFDEESADPNDYPYNYNNIDTRINLVLGTKTSAIISLSTVTTGGAMKYGNYIFFMKYLTDNLDDTYWVAESSPVPIFKGINTIGTIRGDSASNISDKKVTLDISNIDQSYKYIKVGYLRHFSDFNGVATYEFTELDSRFEINQLTDTLTIDVVGTEGAIFLEEAEILLTKDSEIIPLSITQVANRLWGANWKKIQTHDEALIRFAKLIKIGYGTFNVVDSVFSSGSINATDAQYYAFDNYEKIGYFRGEAYPFGVVFELNDGSISEMYPVNGADMWSNITPEYDPDVDEVDKANYDGIFRFPNAIELPYTSLDGTVDFLGVKFDTEEAWMSIMGAENNNWIRFNVRAIHFVRGDRYENLKYQGLMMHAQAPFLENASHYNLTVNASLDGNVIQFGQDTVSPDFPDYPYFQRKSIYHLYSYTDTVDNFWGHWTNIANHQDWNRPSPYKFGPVFRGYAPAMYKNPVSDGNEIRSYLTRYFAKPDKYCFYSPDMLLNTYNDVDDVQYVWRVGKTIIGQPAVTNDNPGIWQIYDETDALYNQTAPKWMRTEMYGEFLTQVEKGNSINQKIMIGESGFIKPGDIGYLDFINYADEPFATTTNFWHWGSDTDADDSNDQWYNRSMRMAKYLGIDFDLVDVDGAGLLTGDDFNLDIVNLYGVDPASIDIRNLFSNINSIQYKKISKPILVSDIIAGIIADNWDDLKTNTCWNGDCFLQRSYFKQMYWAGSSLHYYRDEANWDDISLYDKGSADIDAIRLAHGLVIGLVTENVHNIAMRAAYESATFYPAAEIVNFALSAYTPITSESFNMNFGYDKTLSTNYFLAHDVNLPVRTLQYNTRIKYSDATIPGSFIDAYRSFRVNNYVDFDTNFGSIQKIEVIFDKLISIQDDSINEHYINERATQQTYEGQSAILGYGDILSSNSRKLANFGTQHKWSVVKGDIVYGVDWKMQVIWEVGSQRSSTGSTFLNVKSISSEGFIQKWMRDTALVISNNRSDKTNYYGNDTLHGEGIVGGFDYNNKDVYFIFHKRVENI